MDQSNNLHQKLFSASDDLRSNMDANEYKNYLLGIIFYKYLSDKQLMKFADLWELNTDNLEEIQGEYEALYPTENGAILVEELVREHSYHIKPQHTFTNFLKEIEKGTFQLEALAQGFTDIENSGEAFNGLFHEVDLYSNKLGKGPAERNQRISKVMKKIGDINLAGYSGDVLGDAYEYMISNFASESGKKAGEFYTPSAVSTLMAKIAMLENEDIQGFTVYDPTMGSGSLLLNPKNFSREAKTIRYFGQELNNSTYNLARMNMILHDVPMEFQSLNQGDTLRDDWPVDEPTNFDAVLMNPPYSAKWDATEGFLDDPRYSDYGVLPPKTKADYAFLLHGYYHLKNTGTMAILLPHGVLFRGGAEGKIRKILLDKGAIHAVIGLPANLFYSTGIPVALLILKKDKEDRSVFFIDASQEFIKQGKKNDLTEDNIDKIFDTYMKREDVAKFAHLASYEEIEENDYNLNIPRYVDTFEEEEPIHLGDVAREMKTIQEEQARLKDLILADLEELVATSEEAQEELDALRNILEGTDE